MSSGDIAGADDIRLVRTADSKDRVAADRSNRICLIGKAGLGGVNASRPQVTSASAIGPSNQVSIGRGGGHAVTHILADNAVNGQGVVVVVHHTDGLGVAVPVSGHQAAAVLSHTSNAECHAAHHEPLLHLGHGVSIVTQDRADTGLEGSVVGSIVVDKVDGDSVAADTVNRRASGGAGVGVGASGVDHVHHDGLGIAGDGVVRERV